MGFNNFASSCGEIMQPHVQKKSICKKHVLTIIYQIDSLHGCDFAHLKLMNLVDLGAFDKYEII